MLIDMAARELGISTLALSKRLGISQSTDSESVKRGEKIVKEKELTLMGSLMPIYQYPSPSTVEYIPAATINRAPIVMTPGLANPARQRSMGANPNVMHKVNAPRKTVTGGSLVATRVAKVTARIERVSQASKVINHPRSSDHNSKILLLLNRLSRLQYTYGICKTIKPAKQDEYREFLAAGRMWLRMFQH